jgi:hypothetical protein
VFSAGDATITSSTPEQLRVNVIAQANGRLVLRDTCYPGWVAQVDGAQATIECVDAVFRAVQVPAGEHTVMFGYQPQSVQIGMVISLAGVAAMARLYRVRCLFRDYRFMRGSSASRRPSPTKVNAITSTDTTSEMKSR